MVKNRVKIETEGSKVIYVKRPDRKVTRKAQMVFNRAFRDLLENGAILRSEIDSYMKKRGLWDEEKQKQIEILNEKIEDGLLKLKRGGIKLSEARQIALDIRVWRIERTLILFQRNQLDGFTVEAQAEQEKFDFIVSECTVDESEQRIFKDMDDYNERSSEEYAIRAASALGNMLYDLEENWETKLPENQFLIQHSFMNEKLQLINKEGKLIDYDSNLVDDSMRRINEEGKLIDDNGNLMNEDGSLIIETVPFLDDEGKSIGV